MHAYAPPMLDAHDATDVAERYSLGDDAALSGPVARGEVGQVWRLTTSRGTFAIKEQFDPFPEDEVREHAAFQEAAHAAGIHVPAVIRDRAGGATTMFGDVQVRAFGWVDLRDRTPDVDPAEVGSVVASIHRLPFAGRLPTDPWYTEPVGSDRWDALGPQAPRGVGAVRGSVHRDAGRAGRAGGAHRGAAQPADVPSRSVGRQRPADRSTAPCASSTGRTADWPIPLRSSRSCCSSSAWGTRSGCGRSTTRTWMRAAREGSTGAGTFSMLIAQLGHIGEDACLRWLDTTEPADERARQAARADEFLTLSLTRRRDRRDPGRRDRIARRAPRPHILPTMAPLPHLHRT